MQDKTPRVSHVPAKKVRPHSLHTLCRTVTPPPQPPPLNAIPKLLLANKGSMAFTLLTLLCTVKEFLIQSFTFKGKKEENFKLCFISNKKTLMLLMFVVCPCAGDLGESRFYVKDATWRHTNLLGHPPGSTLIT